MVAPDKYWPGFDPAKGQVDVPDKHVVTHIADLCFTKYKTDAHFLSYVIHDQEGRPAATLPRVNKAGLRSFEEQTGLRALLGTLVADVDNDGHAPWQSREAAIYAFDQMCLKVPTAMVYITRGGLRIIQPMTKWLPVEQGERVLASWLGDLARRGIKVDTECLDWTRYMRCPNVVRDGRPFETMAKQTGFTPIPPPLGPSIARRSRAAAGKAVEVTFANELPTDLERVAIAIADVVRGINTAALGVDGGWHSIALKLAGRLCKEGVRVELVPQLVARIFQLAGDDRISDRLQAAEDTCRRYLARLGVDAEVGDYPGLGGAILAALGRAPAEPPEPAMHISEIQSKILAHLRHPGDGVSMLRVPCGTGKTFGFRQVAAERASKKGRLGTKSALSVPTTELAEQVQRDLQAAGVSCVRFFGPLSVPGPNKGRECHYVPQGRALAQGGISVAVALCRGCDHRLTCKARDGYDGDLEAKVAVGPHELVGELAEHAGSTGLLGIDEPPALVGIETVDDEELRRAQGELHWFDKRYAACMAPILDGVRKWLARGVDLEAGALERGLTEIDPDLESEAFDVSGGTTAFEWASAAMGDRVGEAPPIDEGARYRCRVDLATATAVGKAARVLGLLRRAAIDPEDVAVSVEDHPQSKGESIRRLVFVAVERRMHRALRRLGSTVVLAADADVVRPLVARAIGYEPQLVELRAPEGAKVERTLWRTEGATRKGWLPDRDLKPENVRSIARAVGWAVDWFLAGDTTRPLALVSYMRVADSMRAALGKGARDPHPALRDALKPVLARLPMVPEVGHFGALRGLDRWKELDALASIGDPYPNIGILEREAGWVRAGSASVTTPDDWARLRAAAELEQVHGRLRTIHRTRPARMLHIGNIVPAGWRNVRYVDAPTGRPRGVELDDVRELVARAGGVAVVSKLFETSRRTVQRWISGESRPPPDVAEQLVKLAGPSASGSEGGATERATKGSLVGVSVAGSREIHVEVDDLPDENETEAAE